MVLLGFIAMQVASGLLKTDLKQQKAGPQRGDLDLREATLPETINEWTKTEFIPATPPDQLPEGRYWWTHSWVYTTDKFLAIIAFDQADWQGWHELTVCYEATGWTLAEREICVPANAHDASWSYVVAQLNGNGPHQGIVVFSEFHEDGSPTRPREMNLSELVNKSVGDRMVDRFTYNAEPAKRDLQIHERVLQCQVFVTCAGPFPPEAIEKIVELHLQSRSQFRAAWMNQTASDLPGHGIATNLETQD